MTAKGKGLPTSIQARLLNHARKTGQDYNRVLERYALERFLHRLGCSVHADRFVLKGALVLLVWLGDDIRPTRDADLLGFGDLDDDALLAMFRDICETTVDPDGMSWSSSTLGVEAIRGNDPYGGRRLTMRAHLGAAHLPVQIDVGIGDALVPAPEWLDYPSLLDMPPARLRVYRPETAIAEKLHAIASLGMANSRMKDFFDIAAFITHGPFDGATLAAAVRATFERRGTLLPAEIPVGLTDAFATDATKVRQWNAFASRNRLLNAGGLDATIALIRDFAELIFAALGGKAHVPDRWAAGGPWT